MGKRSWITPKIEPFFAYLSRQRGHRSSQRRFWIIDADTGEKMAEAEIPKDYLLESESIEITWTFQVSE